MSGHGRGFQCINLCVHSFIHSFILGRRSPLGHSELGSEVTRKVILFADLVCLGEAEKPSSSQGDVGESFLWWRSTPGPLAQLIYCVCSPFDLWQLVQYLAHKMVEFAHLLRFLLHLGQCPAHTAEVHKVFVE